MVEIYFRYLPHTPSSQLMYVFNPNQLNQGDDVIINQWELWSDENINIKVIPRMAGFKPAVKMCPPILSQLMYAFNPNQLNQGDDVIINQWEWWSDDIPHDTLCLGTKFVTFRHQNWAICMFRSKRWAWFRLYDFD